MMIKRCAKCQEEKSLEGFYKNRSKPDGLGHYCKECANKASRQSAQNHPQRVRDNARDWRKAHPDKKKAQDQRYYASHRDQILARVTEYQKEHRDQNNKAVRAWERRNPGRKLGYRNGYRARKVAATTETVDYDLILERDGHWCYLCQSDVKPNDVHFDHVIPLSKGGEHSTNNIKVTHSWCNRSKGSKLLANLVKDDED